MISHYNLLAHIIPLEICFIEIVIIIFSIIKIGLKIIKIEI